MGVKSLCYLLWVAPGLRAVQEALNTSYKPLGDGRGNTQGLRTFPCGASLARLSNGDYDADSLPAGVINKVEGTCARKFSEPR
jgi:hypothetical protein